MDVDQLKVILQMVSGVSNNAVTVAVMWFVVAALRALLWPVCIGLVCYTVFKVAKASMRLDELEEQVKSSKGKRDTFRNSIRRAWLDEAITGEEYKASLIAIGEKCPW